MNRQLNSLLRGMIALRSVNPKERIKKANKKNAQKEHIKRANTKSAKKKNT